MNRWSLPGAALLVCAAGALIAHSLLFNFVTDDAFISFVYARNLAQHGQLVFNLGERVEGYTNFLWTVILALGMLARVPPEILSRVLGTACGVLTLLVCTLFTRRLRHPDAAVDAGDAVPALVLAGVPGYACWSSGGLETMLFTLLCTLGMTRYLAEQQDMRPPRLSALWFGLAALTRPEGYLFFGLSALHRLFTGRGGRRHPLLPSRAEGAWLGTFLVLCVPHLLFRRLYYGYWLPNTFYIKTSSLQGAWQQGGFYLWQFARQTQLYWLLLAALCGLRRYRAALIYVLLLTAAFLLYVVMVGGDFMGLHRFLMPIVPINVVLGVLGLYEALARLRMPATAQAALVGALLLLHAANARAVDHRALAFIGADRGIDTPGYLRYYTADRAAIGKWLGRYVQPDDYQVVGGAGAQVYYAGIPALDSFGLSDAYVAHKVPPVSSRPGHQKFAPLDYVLSRKPTIITYNVYKIEDAPYVPGPAEAAMWRARGFHWVSVQVPGLSRPWYSFLKRVDRRLGPLPPADDLD